MRVMEIADLFRIIFYLWLFVSLGVWGYRLYRKVANRGAAPAEGDTAGGDDRTVDATGDASPRRRPKDASMIDRVVNPVTPPLSSADEPGDLVKAVIREELEKKRRLEAGEPAGPTAGATPATAGDTGSQRAGLFAPSDEREPAAPRVTVAEALDGIKLPCDLVPTLMQGDDVDPYKAAFVTSGFSPRTVAANFADELERLDYKIRTDTDNVAIGRRAANEVRVEVFEDAATARVDEQRLFPYVANGSIAIVVST
jgi:hypothetical protein